MTKEYPCPFCDAEYDTAWQLTNHVRASDGEHGPKYSLPKGFKAEGSESNVSTEGPANVSETSESNVSQTSESDVSKGLNDGDLTKVQKVEPPKEKPVVKCPDCGAPKADWVTIAELEKLGYDIRDNIKKEYTHVCTNCDEFIKVKE